MVEAEREPWRHHTFFKVFSAFCIGAFALIVGYEVWMHQTIYSQFEGRFRIEEVGVVKVRCSPDHLWGQIVFYKRMDDDYLRNGRACLDFSTGKWVMYDVRYLKGVIPPEITVQ